MTERATLEALLARVVEGTGPDRELDAEIALALGIVAQRGGNCFYGHKHHSVMVLDRDYYDHDGNAPELPHFTASLDAALTLVPDGKAWTVGQNIHHWYWSASVNALDEDGAPKSIGWGGPSNSPALALCAAALQARMETLGE